MKAFRTYHLFFVLSVIAAYLTAEELDLIHAWAGYAVAAFLALRGTLGLMRANGFGLSRLVPVGSAKLTHALTLALFLCVAGATVTGVVMDRGASLSGASALQMDREGGNEAAMPFGEGERHERESAVGEMHEVLGNALLPLAIVHVFYLLLFRIDMARFMLFIPRKATR